MKYYKLLACAVIGAALSTGCSNHFVGAELSQNEQSNSPQQHQSKYVTFVAAGQKVPVSSFSSIDGQNISLDKQYKKKLIILFANWCSDSQRAMKALSQSSLLTDKDIQIIGIARENTVEETAKFKADYQLPFDFVADEDRSIYRQFASAGIPRFVMLDENNVIVDIVLAEGDQQLELIKWN